MTTPGKIEQACNNIDEALGRYEADPDDLVSLQRALAGLHFCRDAWRDSRDAVEPHLDRVRTLSARLTGLLEGNRERLVNGYLEVVHAIRQHEEAREAIREALLELSQAKDGTTYEGAGGHIEVKQHRTVNLPRAGTPARRELAEVLTRHDAWPQVGTPNAGRLLKAMESGSFPAEALEQLHRICPVQSTPRLSVRLKS